MGVLILELLTLVMFEVEEPWLVQILALFVQMVSFLILLKTLVSLYVKMDLGLVQKNEMIMILQILMVDQPLVQ